MTKEKEISAAGLRIFWSRPAAALRVTGPESFAFLQGQLTNDLRDSTATAPVYGLWLDHKGRVHGDGFVARTGPDEFWIFTERTPAAGLQARLESFIIADDVAIADGTAEWAAAFVIGRQPVPWPDSLGLIALERRGAPAVAEAFVFPVAALAAVRAYWGGAEELPAAELERRRIAAGAPAVPLDIGPGELPQEAGLEAWAVSYSKGCYLGQEVMARLHALGRARRQLVRVRGDGPPPSPGTALFQGERRVGEMKSTSADGPGFVGLALLTLLALQPDAPLALAPSQPGTIVVGR